MQIHLSQTNLVIPALVMLAFFSGPAECRPPNAATSAASTKNLSFASLLTSDREFSDDELIQLTQNRDPSVRQYGVTRLAEIEPITQKAISILVQRLADSSDTVRFQAMAGLMRIGQPATVPLALALRDRKNVAPFSYDSEALNGGRTIHTTVSDLAFVVLRSLPEKDIDVLLESYRSAKKSEPVARKQTTPTAKRVAELRIFGERENPTTASDRLLLVIEDLTSVPTPSVIAAFQSDDSRLKTALAQMLGKSGDRATAAVEVLQVSVLSLDEELSREAASSLGKIRPNGILALRELAGHADARVRVRVIEEFPQDTEDLAVVLTSGLSDGAAQVRKMAVERLNDLWVDNYSDNEEGRRDVVHRRIWRALPNSALTNIIDLSKDPSSEIRSMAVAALGSWGCLRREGQSELLERLIQMHSDPVQEVATTVARTLELLASKNVVPEAKSAVPLILQQLRNTAKKKRSLDLPVVLARMTLPEEHVQEIADVLVPAILQNSYNFERGALFADRPVLADAVARSLKSYYGDISNMDDKAISILSPLVPSSREAYQLLFGMLDHSSARLRARAGVILAKAGDRSTRVMDVLDEASRQFEPHSGPVSDSPDLLTAFGADGLNRIIAIVEDSSVTPKVRNALIFFALSNLIGNDPRIAPLILKNAAQPVGRENHFWVVKAAGKIKDRPEEVLSALEAAYKVGDPEARQATIRVWKELSLPLGDFPERALADANANVREAAVGLLSRFPSGDPQRLNLMKRALADKDEDVRRCAMWKVDELGVGGAEVLTDYVKNGMPLTDAFFETLDDLDLLGETLTAALKARARKSPRGVQSKIETALRRVRGDGPEERKRLRQQLLSADAKERSHAARRLFKLGENMWENNGLIAGILMGARVRVTTENRLGAALDRLYPPGFSYTSGRFDGMPHFPWPPPPGFKRVVVPRELVVAKPQPTLGHVYHSLISALEKASDGFEHGLFDGVPGGFALVARMERIQKDGTPFPGQARWLNQGPPVLDFIDFLGDLFFERPGYFRIVVFAVTDAKQITSDPAAILPELTLGAISIPEHLAKQQFQDQEVVALVYSFERQAQAKVTPWTDGAPSALQHLKKAGIFPTIGATSLSQ